MQDETCLTRGCRLVVKVVVITIFILLTLGLISLISLEFRVSYLKKRSNDELIITVQALHGWLVYKFEVPSIHWSNQGWIPFWHLVTELENRWGEPIAEETLRIESSKLRRFWPVLKYFLPKYWEVFRLLHEFFGGVKLTHLRWITEFGSDDPAETGLTTGCLWALKGWIWANLRRSVMVNVRRPVFIVRPMFQSPRFNLDFDCIFKVRLGHIIITGIKGVWLTHELGFWKSVHKGVNSDDRTPNRNPDEDCNGKHQGDG